MHTALDPRFRKRLPCRLALAGASHAGMVLNLSRGGLFVQTSAAASPGEPLHIELSAPELIAVGVDARVVWRRVVAPHLRAVHTAGMGVHIQHASEAYFGFVARLAEGIALELPTNPDAAGPAFVVRLRLAGSPRTRLVIVSAADEAAARQRAAAQAGAQWSVLEVKERARED